MILQLILSYLIGSVPNGYILPRLLKGIDIRQHGSGNVGATNVFRVAGKKLGVTVFILDVTKGFAASFWISQFSNSLSDNALIAQLICGFTAIIGHTWPVWLQFKGGKGVATSCGVFLGIAPFAVLCSFIVWISCAILTKYVSVSSITAAVTFPITAHLIYKNFTLSTVSLMLAFFIIFTHRANIGRLLNGTESRIGQKS